jgi:Asp-tRNA(Asn)/Glu-tRNA(Gln) amidotransferase A subunit family amidase
VPFAVKNLFDVQGCRPAPDRRSTATLPPSPRDATLIERMEAAGAVLVGALNMGEYAYDFTGENVHDGPSRNPHDVTRMTGGSSGGSGGAVGGGWCRWRWAPTPTARSGCRRRSAAFSG